MRRAAAIAAGVVVMLLATRAAADETPIHLTVPTTVSDGEGHTRSLPPGFFLTVSQWERLDSETRRLQEQEIRLRAENESLRGSGEAPGWWWVVSGIAAGAALGFWVGNL